MRIPYVKKMDGDKCLNPITKDNPYLFMPIPKVVKNSKNNSKGWRVTIVNLGKGVFAKYHSYKQLIPKGNGKYKVITHYIDTRRRTST